MEDIILEHLNRYPHMEIQDIIKLIYQAEFGCEHLIRDKGMAAQRLHAELAGCGAKKPGEPLYESIGEGLCRLNLRPAREKLTEDEIQQLFFACALQQRGDKAGFARRIKDLYRLCEKDHLPFDPAELDLFMATYSLKKCQPVSHSVRYHTLYAPSYRIVSQKQLKDLLKKNGYDPLFHVKHSQALSGMFHVKHLL